MSTWLTVPMQTESIDQGPQLPFAPVGHYNMVYIEGQAYAAFTDPEDEQRARSTPGMRPIDPDEMKTLDAGLPIPALSMLAERAAENQGIGLGDVASWVTRKLGISECEGCNERKHRLNRVRLWLPRR